MAVLAVMFGAILDLHLTLSSNVIFYLLNMFLAPENNFELIVTDLWPFEGFGGHLGRHLEKKNFSEAPILVKF